MREALNAYAIWYAYHRWLWDDPLEILDLVKDCTSVDLVREEIDSRADRYRFSDPYCYPAIWSDREKP